MSQLLASQYSSQRSLWAPARRYEATPQTKITSPLPALACATYNPNTQTHAQKQASKQKSGAGGRARAVRISQEVSTLATSLPVQPDSSIFLRVDEDRFDVMRAMITGPKDTPYEVCRYSILHRYCDIMEAPAVGCMLVSVVVVAGDGRNVIFMYV